MTYNPASVAGYMALQQIAKALLDGAALPTGISEGEHVELGVRSSRTDNRSRYDLVYRWPWPGNWTPIEDCNASYLECARWLHIAHGWRAMCGLGPIQTIQTVAVRPSDIVHRGKTKMRARQVAVLNIVHIKDLADYGRLAGADLNYANFAGADLIGRDFTGAKLRCTNLQSANLTACSFDNADLRNAYIYGATLRNAHFPEASLFEAHLNEADLHRVTFRNADLRFAKLRESNLYLADFTGADLTGTNFQNANLAGACFTGTNIGDANIQGATWSAQTIWPHGYEPPTQNGANHE